MPKKVDHSERRRVISDVVLEVINEHGVTGVTIRDVAERSKWSTGVIAHYFKNRDELLLAALRRAAGLAAARQLSITEVFNGTRAAAAVLEDALPIDSSRRSFARIFLFYYSQAYLEVKLRDELSGYLSSWQRLVKKLLDYAVTEGEFCEHVDTASIAQELIAATDGLSVHMMLNDALAERVRSSGMIRQWIAKAAVCPEPTRHVQRGAAR